MDQQKRFLGIGGSDVAAILNISKYKTAVEVWEEKVNKIISPEPSPSDPKTSHLYWGKVLEPVILGTYSQVSGYETTCGDDAGQLNHPEYPWLIANVDAFAETEEGKIVVEIKNCDRPVKGDWGLDSTDVIPIAYMCQVQHYLHVTGLKRADVAVKFGGSPLKTYKIRPSEIIINMMMPRLDKFWNHYVKKRVPPPPSSLGDVKLIYKDCIDKDIEADDKCLNAISKYVIRAAEMKSITGEQEKDKTIIAEFMGSNTRLVNDGAKLATFAQRKDGVRVFRVF